MALLSQPGKKAKKARANPRRSYVVVLYVVARELLNQHLQSLVLLIWILTEHQWIGTYRPMVPVAAAPKVFVDGSKCGINCDSCLHLVEKWLLITALGCDPWKTK